MAAYELSDKSKKIKEEWENESLTKEQINYNRQNVGETEEEKKRYNESYGDWSVRPTFKLENGKVKVTGSAGYLKSDIVKEAKNTLSNYFKGYDLSNKQVSEAFNKTLDETNKQIDSYLNYQEYNKFLKNSGFSDEAYRNYALAVQEADPNNSTNIRNSKKKIAGYGKDGKTLTMTPAEWLDYYKKNWNPEERAQMWMDAAEALARASNGKGTDKDLYKALPYILMGSKQVQNIPAQIINMVNPFDEGGVDWGKDIENAKVMVPVYGFEDTDHLSVFTQTLLRQLAMRGLQTTADVVDALKNPWYEMGAPSGASFFGIEDFKNSDLAELTREEYQEFAQIARDAKERGLDTYEKLKAEYGAPMAKLLWTVSYFSTLKEDGPVKAVGDGKVLDTIRDENGNVVAEAGDYPGYATYRDLQKKVSSFDEGSSGQYEKWVQSNIDAMNEYVQKMSAYAPNAASAGIVGGQLASIAAEQFFLGLVSGGTLAAPRVLDRLSRAGFRFASGMSKAAKSVEVGEYIISKSPKAAQVISALALGGKNGWAAAEGLDAASKLIYIVGEIGTWALKEVGEDAYRGIVDDIVTNKSIDSQGNLDVNKFVENVYMNAVMAGMAHGVKGAFKGLASIVDNASTRNIDGVELNLSQRHQLDLFQKALDDQNRRIQFKGWNEDGNPVISLYGKTKVLDQLTPSKDVMQTIDDATGAAMPTASRTIEEIMADEEVSDGVKQKISEVVEEQKADNGDIKTKIEEKLTDDEIREAFPDGTMKVGDQTIKVDTKEFTAGDVGRTTGKEFSNMDEAIAGLKGATKTSDFASGVRGILRHSVAAAKEFKQAIQDFADANNMTVRDVMIAIRESRLSGQEKIPGLQELWDNSWKPLQEKLLDLQEALTGIRPTEHNFYFRDMLEGTFKLGDDGKFSINLDSVEDALGGDTSFDLSASSTAHNSGKLGDIAADRLEYDPEVLMREFVASRMQTIWQTNDMGKVFATMEEAHAAGEFDFTEADAKKSVDTTKQVATEIESSEGVQAVQEMTNVSELDENFGSSATAGVDSEIEATKARIADLEKQLGQPVAVKTDDGVVYTVSDEPGASAVKPASEVETTGNKIPVIYRKNNGEVDFGGTYASEAFGTTPTVKSKAWKDWENKINNAYQNIEKKIAQKFVNIDRNKVELEQSEQYRDAIIEAYRENPIPEIPEEVLGIKKFREGKLAQASLVDSSPLVRHGEIQNDTLGAFRRELREKGYDNLSPEAKARVDNVDKDFSQKLTNDMVLYRGETLTDYAKGLKEGDKIDSSAWTYVTPTSSETDLYRRGITADKKSPIKGGVLFRYHTKAGQPVFYDPGAHPLAYSDDEMILPRDMDGTVTKVTNNAAGRVFGAFIPEKIIDVEVKPSGISTGTKVEWGDGNSGVDRIIQYERGASQPAEVDSVNYRTGIVKSDLPFGKPYNKGFYEFTNENINRPSRDIGNIGIEQTLVTPGGPIDTLNAAIRSGEVEVKNGKIDENALRQAIKEGYDEEVFVNNFYNSPGAYYTSDILAADIADPLGIKYTDDKSISDGIKEFVVNEAMKKFYEGNTTAKNNIILYRVISSDGNEVATSIIGGEKPKQGNIDWLKKESGDYVDNGVGFVTMDPDAVLGNEKLAGSGDRYILRMHIAKGTPMFSFENRVMTGGPDILLGDTFRISKGDRAGGEFALAPTKGKFVNSGETDAHGNQIVDVYIGQEPPKEVSAKMELAAEKVKLKDLEARRRTILNAETLDDDVSKVDDDIAAQKKKVSDTKKELDTLKKSVKEKEERVSQAEADEYSREQVDTPETERIKLDIVRKTGQDLDEMPFNILDDENSSLVRMLDETPGTVREGNLRNYKRTGGMETRVILINPASYNRVLLNDAKSNTNAETVERLSWEGKTHKYKQAMQDGDKFPTPYIKYKRDGSWDGQEGRHRAAAAEFAGVEKIPVFISLPLGDTLEAHGFRNYDDITEDIAKLVTANVGAKKAITAAAEAELDATKKSISDLENKLEVEKQKVSDLEKFKSDMESRPEPTAKPEAQDEAGQKTQLKQEVESNKKEILETQRKFNASAKKSNAAELISRNSGYSNRATRVDARAPIGVNFLPGNPFGKFFSWVNDHFTKANSIKVEFSGYKADGSPTTMAITAYNGGYKMYAEAGSFARNVIVDVQNGETLWDAIYKQVYDNGFFIEPSKSQIKKYGALRVQDQAAKVTDKIMDRISNDSRLGHVFNDDGTVKSTEGLISILTTRFMGQGISDFTKFVRKLNWDSLTKGQRDWLNARMYEMTASVNKNTARKVVEGLMRASMALRYKSNMYWNFKNGQLQLTECQRLFTMNKLGDFSATLKRLVTDAEYRQKASDYTYILAADSAGAGLSKSELDSSTDAFVKVGAASVFSKEGILTNIDTVKAKFGEIDDAALASIHGGEYAKNFILIAGFLAAGERQGLSGAELDAYVRNRFNVEALAGTKVGKIGLTDSRIGQFTFMYLGFPIRDLVLQVHTIRGGGTMGGKGWKRFVGAADYLGKMLGAKGLMWAVEAPWGYSLMDQLNIDPFGVLDQYDPINTPYEEREPGWRVVDYLVKYNPLLQGAMTNTAADIYMKYRAAEEEARANYKEQHDGSTEGFQWSIFQDSAENFNDIMQGLAPIGSVLNGYIPGYTAYSRVVGEMEDLDRGYHLSQSGNRMYETNTDLGNALWGAFTGRKNTANAQAYYQTPNPIRGLIDNGIAGLGQQLERALPVKIDDLLAGKNPFRKFREFDPVDSETYDDWFDGSYQDQQNWTTGLYQFREEAQQIQDKYDNYISEGREVNTMNARENELADLRTRLEAYAKAYAAKHPEGISISKQNQLINVLNMNKKKTLDQAFAESQGEYTDEWDKAENRYMQGDFPTPYGLTQNEKGEISYAQSPQLQQALSQHRYGISSDAAPAIKQLYNSQEFDTPLGKMTMKAYHDAVYEQLQAEWDKSKPNYDKISSIQDAYLKQISKNIIQPILNTYGSSVLSAGKSSDIMQEFGKMLYSMIPSNEYRIDKKGRQIYKSTPYMTVDIPKWLNKNFGAYKKTVNTTNRATQDRLDSIRSSLNQGHQSTAKAKARALIQDIGNGKASVSRDELEWLQGVLND